jgi:hypothetical protein
MSINSVIVWNSNEIKLFIKNNIKVTRIECNTACVLSFGTKILNTIHNKFGCGSTVDTIELQMWLYFYFRRYFAHSSMKVRDISWNTEFIINYFHWISSSGVILISFTSVTNKFMHKMLTLFAWIIQLSAMLFLFIFYIFLINSVFNLY